MEMERMKASSMELIGLSTVMCLTSEEFHTRRRMKVLIRMESTKTRSSLTISDLFSDLARLANIFINN